MRWCKSGFVWQFSQECLRGMNGPFSQMHITSAGFTPVFLLLILCLLFKLHSAHHVFLSVFGGYGSILCSINMFLVHSWAIFSLFFFLAPTDAFNWRQKSLRRCDYVFLDNVAPLSADVEQRLIVTEWFFCSFNIKLTWIHAIWFLRYLVNRLKLCWATFL